MKLYLQPGPLCEDCPCPGRSMATISSPTTRLEHFYDHKCNKGFIRQGGTGEQLPSSFNRNCLSFNCRQCTCHLKHAC